MSEKLNVTDELVIEDISEASVLELLLTVQAGGLTNVGVAKLTLQDVIPPVPNVTNPVLLLPVEVGLVPHEDTEIDVVAYPKLLFTCVLVGDIWKKEMPEEDATSNGSLAPAVPSTCSRAVGFVIPVPMPMSPMLSSAKRYFAFEMSYIAKSPPPIEAEFAVENKSYCFPPAAVGWKFKPPPTALVDFMVTVS